MISVVIPLYNKEKSIENTIKSVLAQSYSNFEIVVIDDGSTDESAMVVHNISDTRIRYIYQKNQGVSAARNRGVSESKGEWIFFLDADDMIYPDCLDYLMILSQNYNTLISSANFYVTRKGCLQPYSCKKFEGIIKNNLKSYLDNILFLRTGNTLINRSIILNHRFNTSYQRFEDFEFFYYLYCNFKIAYSSKIVFEYLPGNIMLSKPQKDLSKDYMCNLQYDKNSNIWQKLVFGYCLSQAILDYPQIRSFYVRKFGWRIIFGILFKIYIRLHR